jgi:hypothetical protein
MEYWGVRKAGVASCLLRVRRMGMVAAQHFVLVLVLELVLQRVLTAWAVRYEKGLGQSMIETFFCMAPYP